MSGLEILGAGGDPNPQPRDYQSPALTVAPRARIAKRPPIARRAAVHLGGDEGDRTPDLLTASQALSPAELRPQAVREILYGNIGSIASNNLKKFGASFRERAPVAHWDNENPSIRCFQHPVQIASSMHVRPSRGQQPQRRHRRRPHRGAPPSRDPSPRRCRQRGRACPQRPGRGSP